LLLALTRRDACRQALLEVISTLPGWQKVEQRPVFVSSFDEAQRAHLEMTACVVDLGSLNGPAHEIAAAIHQLVGARPWLNVILVAPHMNPDVETEVIFRLRDVRCLGLVQPRELRDAERWQAVLQDQFVERHAMLIEADLRDACPPKLASFFEDPQIQELLRLGAHLRRVADLAIASGRERSGVWRRFKQRWGHSPSEMLSLFRVLWAAHLRHEGYANLEIARLLGFRDAHHYARRLGARLRLPKSVLNGLGYSDVVASVADCLVRRVPANTFGRRAAAKLKRTRSSALFLSNPWKGR